MLLLCLSSVQLGLVGLIVSTFWFAMSSSYLDLLVARAIQGISGSATWVVGYAWFPSLVNNILPTCVQCLMKNWLCVYFNSLAMVSDVVEPSELGAMFGLIQGCANAGIRKYTIIYLSHTLN